MNDPNERAAAATRLWAAVMRDLPRAVEMFAGLTDTDAEEANSRWESLLETWNALCDIDMRIAAALAHGLTEVSMALAGDEDGPYAHYLREVDEMVGVAGIGRDANPEAEVENLGQLYKLGEDEIQRQLDEELGQ